MAASEFSHNDAIRQSIIEGIGEIERREME
jgi:hypothetical protein